MRTRKDFRAAAALIRSMDEPTRSERALEQARQFAGENPRFDRRTFLEACDAQLCDGPMWMRLIEDDNRKVSQAEAYTAATKPVGAVGTQEESPFARYYRICCMTCGAHISDNREAEAAVESLAARTRHVRYRGALIFSQADAQPQKDKGA